MRFDVLHAIMYQVIQYIYFQGCLSLVSFLSVINNKRNV